MNKRFYKVDEVAAYLGVEVSTIYGWVHTRQIPHYKFGRLLKFRTDEIEQWISERKVEMVRYD